MGGGVQNSKVQLFDARTSETTVVQGSDGLRQPRCSPDGRYMAATTQDGKKLRLYQFDTGNWSDLSTSDIGFLQWSVDSKSIYFDTGSSKELAIYRVRVADRKLERLADLQNFRRVVDPWVSWMGLTPDNSPLLMRDIGSQEVYALDFDEP
jgi:Tol biopolymer transport system component